MSERGQHQRLQITLPSSLAEAIGERMVEEGAPGYEQRDESTLQKPPPGLAQLLTWIPREQAGPLAARMEAILREQGIAEPDVALFDESADDEAAWRDGWKRFFQVQRIGQHLVVRPSWLEHQALAGDLVVDLDPGRAFGTGRHSSTRLVLELLERRAASGKATPRILDVGCGSGILAFFAARLWPGAVVLGVDIDPEAIEVARENAGLNGLSHLGFETTPVEQVAGEFTLVLGNLSAPVLRQLAAPLWRRVGAGGSLIASGILVEEAAGLSADLCALRPAQQLARADSDDGWAVLELG